MALTPWTTQQVLNQLDAGYHWSGSTITYAFPTVANGIFGSTERAGFQALNPLQQSFAEIALRVWDDLIAADLQKTTALSSQIEFGLSGLGVDYAQAYFPSQGSVWFNRYTAELTNPKIGEHGFMTYVHETGHAFGLDHMGSYNGNGNWTPSCYQDSTMYSVMSYFGPSWGTGNSNGEGLVAWADWVGGDGRRYAPQTPMLNDILAMQTIYGAETSTRTEDTVYGFSANVGGPLSSIYNFVLNPNPILTIFDSWGNDTLNLSGWSTASSIDLTPGSFSSCDSMTNNIAIAYGCDIENAVSGAGADSLVGNTLGNYLDAGAGNDRILGAAGNDTLLAGPGNDTLDGGEGNDSVVFAGPLSSYSLSLGNGQLLVSGQDSGTDTIGNVENLVFADLTKSAADLGLIIASSPTPPPSVAEATDANLTDDLLPLPSGDDYPMSTAGSGVLKVGGPAVTGAIETMYDGDLFQVDLSAGRTYVFTMHTVAGSLDPYLELYSPSMQGLAYNDDADTATLDSRITYTATSSGTHYLAAWDWSMYLTGSYTISASAQAGLTLTGTAAANTLTGSGGDDLLSGLDGNDTLLGNAGNDTLAGGSGADRMNGGSGDDTYIVDSLKDTVTEGVNAGRDRVESSLSHTLGANVEDLLLTGSAAISGTGNALANVLTGNAAANTLDGKAGNDSLAGGDGNDVLLGGLGNDSLGGGLGADTFVFNTLAKATNTDLIVDFQSGSDSIRLSLAIFTALGRTAGRLSETRFWAGATAVSGHDADDRLVYNTSTGTLYYDSDGSGRTAAVPIALLGSDAHPALTWTDIALSVS